MEPMSDIEAHASITSTAGSAHTTATESEQTAPRERLQAVQHATQSGTAAATVALTGPDAQDACHHMSTRRETGAPLASLATSIWPAARGAVQPQSAWHTIEVPR